MENPPREPTRDPLRIALEAEQHALVKRKAAELGISMAEHICRLVERDLRQAGAGIADLEIAAQIRDAFADQEFPITDRTRWSIMQRLGVHEALSFERDYLIYRFGRDRRQAFTVHA